MAGTVIIRGIPTKNIEAISQKAKKNGMSREEYLRIILEKIATNELENELADKYGSLVQMVVERAKKSDDLLMETHSKLDRFEEIISALDDKN